jgi:segregation and condensation protein A
MTEPALGLESYQLRLPSFEGPLDVLLSLIEREQLEISDLSLMAVTEGFLRHIDEMEDPPPALLAEFLGVAARLLLLKSRALLPKPETEEAPDEVDDLAGQLREYQRARQLAANLHEYQMAHWRSYTPSAPPPARPTRVSFVLPPVATLGKAFLRALARQPVDPEQLSIRRVVTVAEMAARLHAAVLGFRGRRRFLDLVDRNDREEVVAGFIALLALWRRRQVEVTQTGLFGEIEVEAHAPVERTVS